MALGDNFMWDPDMSFIGETTDEYFYAMGAFEIVSFNFGLTPEDSGSNDSGDSGGGGGGGAAGAKQPRTTTGMNAGVMGGVKLGGSVSRKLSGGGATGGKAAGGPSGGGGAKGKPKFGPLTVNKFVDSASPTLYQYCSKGDIIPTINMAIRKSGGDHLLYLQYCFRYNQITGITWSGGEGDHRPAEVFTMEFKAMGMQYIRQAATGQDPDAPQEWRWSVETLDPTGNTQHTLTIGGEPPEEPVFLPGIVQVPKGGL